MPSTRKTRFIIADCFVNAFELPYKSPFITALGRKASTVNVGFSVRLHGGQTGYGEASGSIVNAALSPKRLTAELNRAARQLRGDVRDKAALLERATIGLSSPAAAAVECALEDALAGAYGAPLNEWLGGCAAALETDVTVSADSPPGAARFAAQARRDGFVCFKLKVGTNPQEDWKRMESVWRAVGSRKGASILLDGNQSMTSSSCLRLVERALKKRIAVRLVEQPLARGGEKSMAALKKRLPVPLAADESLRSSDDALRLLDLDAADVFNIKLAKTGIEESRRVIALARAAGKKLMIGCMAESARGLWPSVALACGTGAFDFIDLDTDYLLQGPPARSFTRHGRRLLLGAKDRT